jgi:hypothetical protein
MDMIGHENEVVNCHFSGAHIGSKNFYQERRHAVSLEERSSACCSRSYKKRSWVK